MATYKLNEEISRCRVTMDGDPVKYVALQVFVAGSLKTQSALNEMMSANAILKITHPPVTHIRVEHCIATLEVEGYITRVPEPTD
jgi:hypothetical protein